MLDYIYIDFEFYDSKEPFLKLVSCAFDIHTNGVIKSHDIWLHKKRSAKRQLKEFLEKKKKSHTIVCFGAVAEARSFLALGLDPTEFKFIDLYVEWRQLTYKNHKCMYGTYFIPNTNMKRKSTPPPEWGDDKKDHKLMGYSLVDCVAYWTGENLGKVHKKEMIELIIEGHPKDFTEEEKERILDYGRSDIKYLQIIHNKMFEMLFTLTSRSISGATPEDKKQVLRRAQIYRAKFCCLAAIMENEGIPVNINYIKNLMKNQRLAQNALIEKLNTIYPFFDKVRNSGKSLKTRYIDKYANFAKFIENHPLIDTTQWKKTKGRKNKDGTVTEGQYSTEDKYLKQWDGIPELRAYRETTKILGQLKWMSDEGKYEGNNILDSIGSDNRLRTFFGVFGTFTSRNAPAAKRFIFAMSAWLRCLIEAPPGYVIIEADYSSQEFGIAAVLSGDKAMQEAYASGDPYLYFAQGAKAIPADANPVWVKSPHKCPHEEMKKQYEEYKDIRNLFKATVLGLQYGMKEASLAVKLTIDTGKYVSENKALKLMRLHQKLFPAYWKWLDRIWEQYQKKGSLFLKSGWAMLGDNFNPLSAKNFPSQGHGGAVLHKAVELLHEALVTLISTLHDSAYALCLEEDEEETKALMEKNMKDAVKLIIGGDLEFRIDFATHRHGETWISEKGREYYELLKQYLEPIEKEDQEAKIRKMLAV